MAKKASSSKKKSKKASRKKTSSASKAKKTAGTAKKSTAKKADKAASHSRKSSAKTSSGKAAKKKTSRASSASKASKKTSKKNVKASGTSRSSDKKVKTQLSKSELAEFREMLLEKRRDIIGDMNGMEAGALGPDRPESGSDISDLGSDNFEQEFTLGLLQSERALLNEINEALARIEEGTYGICLGTRKPIGKARLTARPWTPYSIEYARLIERGVVRPGDLWLDDEDEDDEDDLSEDVDDQADDDLDDDLDEDEDDDLDDEDLDEDLDDEDD